MHDWLQWQERLHSQPIELGLDRVAAVAARLEVAGGNAPVITVAGTNGKGSTVRYLESIYTTAGYRVGAYTSPHLLRYNERLRIAGVDVDDTALCAAFAAVEQARAGVSLTYFEFGTLAALWLFAQARPDVWLLEVGLGGRLDAVNIVDPDVAIISSIGLDHQEWLGPDRESIAIEKAGIMREGGLAVCGDRRPPASLLRTAAARAAKLECLGVDFEAEPSGQGMRWRQNAGPWQDHRAPGLPGAVQIDNAACALRAVAALQPRLAVTPAAIDHALGSVRLSGRLEKCRTQPEIWLDVGHNPDALRVLAEELTAEPVQGLILAVVAMLGDKAIPDSIDQLRGCVDLWFPATLAGPRALPARELQRLLNDRVGPQRVAEEATVGAAIDAALERCNERDRVIVFGSFLTVAQAMRHPVVAAATRSDVDSG